MINLMLLLFKQPSEEDQVNTAGMEAVHHHDRPFLVESDDELVIDTIQQRIQPSKWYRYPVTVILTVGMFAFFFSEMWNRKS